MNTVKAQKKANVKGIKAPNDIKLKELILLIATKSEGDQPFGATKLNKLLFYADFFSYIRFGQPITGQEYQKLPQGPAPRRLLPAMREMEQEGHIAIRDSDYYGRNQKRAFALRQPDISLFESGELEIVQDLIKTLWGRSATEVSELSHKFVGWKLAGMGETIPYNVALIGDREPTAQERRIGLAFEPLAKSLKQQQTATAA